MNKLSGIVLWYDKRNGHGIIIDANDNEHYVDSSVLQGLQYLDDKDAVLFEVNPAIKDTLCACNVSLALQCEGGNAIGKENDACEQEGCQACCPHSDERDHGICIDCGHEEDPGMAVDRAMARFEDR